MQVIEAGYESKIDKTPYAHLRTKMDFYFDTLKKNAQLVRSDESKIQF